jgi:hypothetical protein
MRFQAQASDAAAHWIGAIEPIPRRDADCATAGSTAIGAVASSTRARCPAILRMAFPRSRLQARIAAAGWLDVSQNDAVALRVLPA